VQGQEELGQVLGLSSSQIRPKQSKGPPKVVGDLALGQGLLAKKRGRS